MHVAYCTADSGLSQNVPAHHPEGAGENRYFDIIDSDIDLAIRTKEYEPDSNITIRRLAETRRVLAASPGYLQRMGTPKTIDDLARHDLLIYSHANQPRVMRFTQGKDEVAFKAEPIMETNDGQIVRAAALAGGGFWCNPNTSLMPIWWRGV